jgi:hypothetical protein
MYDKLIDLLARLATLLITFLSGWWSGLQRIKSKETKENLDALRTANDTRRRLDGDPAYRQRMRDLFTRR